MPWNNQIYLDLKAEYEYKLDNKKVKPYDLMLEYKKMVNDENYEACKAITESLKPFNYNTADTHKYIPKLNEIKN